MATGLHRPNEGAELTELIGDEWVLRTVAVRDPHNMDYPPTICP